MMRYEIKEKPNAWVICQVRSNGATIKELRELPFQDDKDRIQQFVNAKKEVAFERTIGLS